MGQVDLTLLAHKDLAEIWHYVATDSLWQADRLVEFLTQKFEHLARNNGLGRPRPELAEGCRSYPAGRYCIYYRQIETGVLICGFCTLHVISNASGSSIEEAFCASCSRPRHPFCRCFRRHDGYHAT